VLILFKEKPPTQPSSSAEIKKLPFSNAIKVMVSNKSFMVFALVFGFSLGVFNGLGTAIDIIVDAFDHKDIAAVVGAMFIVGGLVGSGVLGFYADKSHRFKFLLVLI